MKILDLGCGPHAKKDGSIGLDKRPAPHVDVVHDMNQYPYPFPDNEFEWIEMSHIIEHVDRPLRLMNEVHRIAKNGATVRIITPHYTSQLSYGDFEHFHHFGYITFLTLQNTSLFRIRNHKLHFTDLYRITGVSALANLFPRRWEKYLGFMLPALYIEVFLDVVKGDGQKNVLVDKYMY
ncbi:MAG TPA: class I SAM-dependent methyltransferase [Bacteroidota bacterium]|jgi:SAM-dependent methyltransferase|nr:class I SAM-dependent methyltransferase [Bacteroidota bacterium]